ncbi:MAG TPA: hypothetical protein DCZ95_03800 [Verrucomicrobia bacterium]|nr:hypothetical protein [Verrucomicrobiota bacterium]
MENPQDVFRKKLWEIIKERGLRQGFAEGVGVNNKWMNDFLAGRKPLSQSKQADVARVLGIQYYEMFKPDTEPLELKTDTGGDNTMDLVMAIERLAKENAQLEMEVERLRAEIASFKSRGSSGSH